jgi:hypothetical protein
MKIKRPSNIKKLAQSGFLKVQTYLSSEVKKAWVRLGNLKSPELSHSRRRPSFSVIQTGKFQPKRDEEQ